MSLNSMSNSVCIDYYYGYSQVYRHRLCVRFDGTCVSLCMYRLARLCCFFHVDTHSAQFVSYGLVASVAARFWDSTCMYVAGSEAEWQPLVFSWIQDWLAAVCFIFVLQEDSILVFTPVLDCWWHSLWKVCCFVRFCLLNVFVMTACCCYDCVLLLWLLVVVMTAYYCYRCVLLLWLRVIVMTGCCCYDCVLLLLWLRVIVMARVVVMTACYCYDVCCC